MKNGKYTDEYGTKRWYQNGKLHRDNAPAVIWASGDEYWYQNGTLYRYDGPAVIFTDGTGYWYHHGKMLSEDEIQQRKRELEADSLIREMLTS